MAKKKALNKTMVYGSLIVLLVFLFLLFFGFSSFQKRVITLLWKQTLDGSINCHATSPAGNLVAVGMVDGGCIVFDQSGKKVFEKKFDFPILDLKFSFSGGTLYIKGQSLLAVNLSTKKVWEKFKKDFIVDDFWVFRNGRCSVLFQDKKDIKLVYQHLDQNGQTVKEFVLPEVFGNFSCTHSLDGKYLLFSIQEGDLYLFQSDGTVVWNIHLDPSVKEVDASYPMFPIYQDVSNVGSVCLGYRGEEYGKNVFLAQVIDNKGNTIWRNNYTSPISGIMFSPDQKKILVSSKNSIAVVELSGKNLYSLDQFGYQPVLTKIGSTNLLIGFMPVEVSSELGESDYIIKLVSLSRKKVLWQKRVLKEVTAFSMEKNGYIVVEVTKNQVMYYRYVLQ